MHAASVINEAFGVSVSGHYDLKKKKTLVNHRSKAAAPQIFKPPGPGDRLQGKNK